MQGEQHRNPKGRPAGGGTETEKIIAVIASYPQGVTTVELAQRLGKARGGLASRLCKFYFYGFIDREAGYSSQGVGHPQYTWKAKA